jgi:hypothetical protein
MQTMRFVGDEPISGISDDTLGFASFAQSIYDSVKNTHTPFVYGILGDWGSGKTSTMKVIAELCKKDLDKNGPFNVVIWVDAWKYENEANMIYPILYHIKRDYAERVKNKEMADSFMREFVKVVSSTVFALADIGLRFTTKTLTGEALKAKDLAEALDLVEKDAEYTEQALSKWADEVAGVEQYYRNLISTYAKALGNQYYTDQNNIRFIFMIDDLDRCLPDVAISVLEKIKNFLSVKQCIYVLGLNPWVIYNGIKTKYSGQEIDGRAYLEKILNYSFFVPDPEPLDFENFLKSRLGILIEDDKVRKELEPAFQELGRVLKECNFTNPRRVQRILNRYITFLTMYRDRLGKNSIQTDNVVRLIVIGEYFPELFRVLAARPESAVADLKSVLQEKMTVGDFEEKHGMSLGFARDRVTAMKRLFDFSVPSTPGQPQLNAYVDTVYQLTRIR